MEFKNTLAAVAAALVLSAGFAQAAEDRRDTYARRFCEHITEASRGGIIGGCLGIGCAIVPVAALTGIAAAAPDAVISDLLAEAATTIGKTAAAGAVIGIVAIPMTVTSFLIKIAETSRDWASRGVAIVLAGYAGTEAIMTMSPEPELVIKNFLAMYTGALVGILLVPVTECSFRLVRKMCCPRRDFSHYVHRVALVAAVSGTLIAIREINRINKFAAAEGDVAPFAKYPTLKWMVFRYAADGAIKYASIAPVIQFGSWVVIGTGKSIIAAARKLSGCCRVRRPAVNPDDFDPDAHAHHA